MKALTYHVHLMQPLLVTQVVSQEENSSISMDYIPGSAIRGAMANMFFKSHAQDEVQQRKSFMRDVFFDGGVYFLNAYPLSSDGRRVLPKPLSWRVDKEKRDDSSTTIFDYALIGPDDRNLPKQTSLVNGAFFQYCYKKDMQSVVSAVSMVSPRRISATHNFSNERFQKRQNESGVFRYDALDQGQDFAGVILSSEKMYLNALYEKLKGCELSLGGSRSAGYGGVRFENVVVGDTDWDEYTSQARQDKFLLVTLVSDTILRAPDGGFTTSLSDALGIQKPEKAYIQSHVVGGFNKTWGLPSPQSLAVRAGSVYVFSTENDLDVQRLRAIEKSGIGEQCIDGYGRIAIDMCTFSQITQEGVSRIPSHINITNGHVGNEPIQTPNSVSLVVTLSDKSRALAQQMINRRLRAVLDQNLLEALARLSECTGEINPHQLNRVRTAVRRAWRDENPHEIQAHMKDLKAPAQEQFRRARIKLGPGTSERLSVWLAHAYESDDKSLWNQYLKPKDMPAIAGVEPDAKTINQLQTEYTARLVDGVLRQLARHIQHTEVRSAGGEQ